MEFPIKIREATQSDMEQICLISNCTAGSREITNRKMIEERIRSHADTFLLASLDDVVIAYILGTDLANSSLSRWIEEVANVELISDRNYVIADLSVHPDYQRQGFGTLLLAAFKQVVLQQNSPGIYLLCEDELLAYFEMNGFVEQGIIEGERSSEFAFLMHWQNPYYQEEI